MATSGNTLLLKDTDSFPLDISKALQQHTSHYKHTLFSVCLGASPSCKTGKTTECWTAAPQVLSLTHKPTSTGRIPRRSGQVVFSIRLVLPRWRSGVTASSSLSPCFLFVCTGCRNNTPPLLQETWPRSSCQLKLQLAVK